MSKQFLLQKNIWKIKLSRLKVINIFVEENLIYPNCNNYQAHSDEILS